MLRRKAASTAEPRRWPCVQVEPGVEAIWRVNDEAVLATSAADALGQAVDVVPAIFQPTSSCHWSVYAVAQPTPFEPIRPTWPDYDPADPRVIEVLGIPLTSEALAPLFEAGRKFEIEGDRLAVEPGYWPTEPYRGDLVGEYTVCAEGVPGELKDTIRQRRSQVAAYMGRICSACAPPVPPEPEPPSLDQEISVLTRHEAVLARFLDRVRTHKCVCPPDVQRPGPATRRKRR